MSSVTEDRIEAAIQRMWIEIEKFYDSIFRDLKPDEETFTKLLWLEDGLTECLSERPLTSMQIRAFMVTHTRAFKKVCLDAKESGGITERSGSPAG